MARVDVEGLADGETRVVPYPDGTPPYLSIIVLRRQGAVYAYWNVCKHLPIPLDSGVGQILEDDAGRLVCNTHGAAYEAHTGACVLGPCVGARLEPLRAVLDGDCAYVDVSD